MTVGELIQELEKLDKSLNVMAAGEEAEKVVVETCNGNTYVRIFNPWDLEITGRRFEEWF